MKARCRPDRASVHLLHRSESGIREDRLDKSAWHYAGELARYITSASTIRMHVLHRFGYTVPVEDIEDLQAKRAGERAAFRAEADGLRERPNDFRDFEVRQTGRWVFDVPIVVERFVEPTLAKPRPVLSSEIVSAICRDFGVSVEEMMGGTRKQRIMLARRTAMYVLRARGSSLPQVASRLSLKDHTSVLHGVRAFEERATSEMREIAARYIVREAA